MLVSTDDTEIGDAASEAGADIIYRPECLATDEASSWDVMRHAANGLDDDEMVVWAQCTAPLMSVEDIGRCLCESAMFGYDMAVCVHESHDFYISEDGTPLFDVPPKRRQDTEVKYVLSGSCWAFRKNYLRQKPYSGRIKPVLSQNPIRLDIDTPADLELARALIPEPVLTYTPDVY